MAYFDSLTQFSTAQAITTTADATNVYDVCGVGAGTAPTMIGPNGVNTAMGVDIGAGDGAAVPDLFITVTTAGTGAGTISYTLSAAPDNGSYSAGTYVVLYTSDAFVGTALKAGRTFKVAVPPYPQLNSTGVTAIPRFYKLTYTVSGSATASFTAGIILNAPDIRTPVIYGNNFVSA